MCLVQTPHAEKQAALTPQLPPESGMHRVPPSQSPLSSHTAQSVPPLLMQVVSPSVVKTQSQLVPQGRDVFGPRQQVPRRQDLPHRFSLVLHRWRLGQHRCPQRFFPRGHCFFGLAPASAAGLSSNATPLAESSRSKPRLDTRSIIRRMSALNRLLSIVLPVMNRERMTS